MTEAAGPMVAAQNAYPAQQHQHAQQQSYKTSEHKSRNKRIKRGLIGGAIGAGAGALLGGGTGAAIGAAAGGATGALLPTHHHHSNPNNR
jgi:outer membrane lipoprotein SlyB